MADTETLYDKAVRGFQQYLSVFGPSAPEDEPQDVYAYYNLMLRAQAAFRAIQGRWEMLSQWGVTQKLPSTKPAVDNWTKFEQAWTAKTSGGAFAGLADMANLRQAALDLEQVEHQAQAAGFRPGEHLELVQVPSEAEQDQALVDVTTGVDRAFAQLNMGIDEKERQVSEFASDLTSRIANYFTSIPWLQIGLGAAGVLIAVGLVGAWAAKPTIVIPTRGSEERA